MLLFMQSTSQNETKEKGSIRNSNQKSASVNSQVTTKPTEDNSDVNSYK